MMVLANRDCDGQCCLIKYQELESCSKGHCHSLARVKGRAQEKEPNGGMGRRQKPCINRLITTNKTRLSLYNEYLQMVE